MCTIAIEALTPLYRASRIKLYKNIARSRLFRRIAKRSIGTHNYNLANFLIQILQPIALGQYTVNDSFAFVLEITAYKTDCDPFMASFDVSSLFTNVPLDECVDLLL